MKSKIQNSVVLMINITKYTKYQKKKKYEVILMISIFFQITYPFYSQNNVLY